MRLPRLRTFREFAEQEIILPEGPREGLPFSCAFAPFTGLILDVFDSGKYRRHWLTGPVQGGKSLIGLAIPLMYHLFEVGEKVVFGAPTMETAQGVFMEKILPVIKRSRFADLLPTKGRGARGGMSNSIAFKNGAILRFMGAGGGDEARSTFTARIVILTESDKMDQPGPSSREADPVTQFEARSASFGDRARLYAECTLSTTAGRTNQEITDGTDTRLALRCPHCQQYIQPTRECLTGWQGAEDAIAARESGVIACPGCGAYWTEADRNSAQHVPLLVARGQEIKDGELIGERPRTNKFGFRWNFVASPLTPVADIAEQEWHADRSGAVSAQKALHQFVWALPFDEGSTGSGKIERDVVIRKATNVPRGIMPSEYRALTVGVDLGLYVCWFSAWAWKTTMEGCLVDCGPIEVPQDRQADPTRILVALRAFRDQVLRPGWARPDGSPVKPGIVLVDAGGGRSINDGFRDIAQAWALESGPGYYPVQGMGTGRDQRSWAVKDGEDGYKVTVQPNGSKLILLDSDRWKREVHEGFHAPAGAGGSLALFAGDVRDHLQYAKHICAEQREEVFDPGKGLRVFWNKTSRDNHMLDCTAYAMAAARIMGFKRAAPELRPRATRRSEPPDRSGRQMNQRKIDYR